VEERFIGEVGGLPRRQTFQNADLTAVNAPRKVSAVIEIRLGSVL